MRHDLKQFLRWVGGALAIAGIVFVILRLQGYGSEIDFTSFNKVKWMAVGIFILVYGFSNVILSFAWWNLLLKFGARTTRCWAIRTYGISQLAKYVPGNIFHLAGRQALGMAEGVLGWPLAKSTIWELGLVTLAGAVLGMFALPLVVPDITVLNVCGIIIIAFLVVVILLGHYATPKAAKAFAWYVLFLCISSALFVGLIQLVSPLSITNTASCFMVGGAYLLAWLAGFLTPGAPAGLGVREFVLIFLLQDHVVGAYLLLAILLGRAVSVCGDLLFFVSVSLVGSRRDDVIV